MWILVSLKRERKNFGGTQQRRCGNCQNQTDFSLILTRLWVCLFFIPIFVWRDDWTFECPVCERGLPMSGKALDEVKELNRARRGGTSAERVAVTG